MNLANREIKCVVTGMIYIQLVFGNDTYSDQFSGLLS